MKPRWKIIARHKWVTGATITESCLDDPKQNLRRFTATISGWNNWKIWEGDPSAGSMGKRITQIRNRVIEIRDRIDAGDKSIFMEQG
jgi:ribosomal protein L3